MWRRASSLLLRCRPFYIPMIGCGTAAATIATAAHAAGTFDSQAVVWGPTPALVGGRRSEGHWRTLDAATNAASTCSGDVLPWPQAHPAGHPALAPFHVAVAKVEAAIERNMGEVPGGELTHFKGLSPCRLCDSDDDGLPVWNGSREYSAQLDAQTRIYWPQGLAHYHTVHHVMPSQLFHNFIMSCQVSS